MRDLIAALIILVAGIIIGLAAYHHLLRWEPMQEATATFKPGTVQADGSADLTRIPTAPKDAGPAPHMLPKGAKETARAHVKVRPKPVTPANQLDDLRKLPVCECEAIGLDLSLIQGKDGTGIIASADNAEIDVSASTYTPMLDPSPPQYRNFILTTNEPGNDSYSGLFGRRYLGNRFGIAIGGTKQEGQPIRALVGLEFNF